jgi:hypothetical protein
MSAARAAPQRQGEALCLRVRLISAWAPLHDGLFSGSVRLVGDAVVMLEAEANFRFYRDLLAIVRR